MTETVSARLSSHSTPLVDSSGEDRRPLRCVRGVAPALTDATVPGDGYPKTCRQQNTPEHAPAPAVLRIGRVAQQLQNHCVWAVHSYECRGLRAMRWPALNAARTCPVVQRGGGS